MKLSSSSLSLTLPLPSSCNESLFLSFPYRCPSSTRKSSLSSRSSKNLGRCFSSGPCVTQSSMPAMRPEDSLAGRLFGSSEDPEWWDSRCLFHPVVVKDSFSSDCPWRMYYYGRGTDSWHSGVTPALLSTGRIGMARSEDGVNWSRFWGPLPNGAIMDPNEAYPSSFDCVHVGCSDVFFHEGQWWMYYFGGDSERLSLGQPEKSVIGFRLRTGLARSHDGITFKCKEEPVLDVGCKGEWDELMVAWARVIAPTPPTSPVIDSAACRASPWLMTYSSLETLSSPPHFAIGVAISDDGTRWTKLGKTLERGSPGAWDEGGVGRRHVIQLRGNFLMFYEGVDSKGVHGIGLALSRDGISWQKDKEAGKEPGGPIFARRTSANAWDSGSVASPHVVNLNNGCFGLYYVGSNASKKESAMGLALSDGSDIRHWTRIDSTLVFIQNLCS